ncbi:MAG: hypothetical protein K5886_12225 [Lachnospiraceae bacterium]|nr:hypothetical protein [Lachnospiraceae bacterium]
MFKRIVSVAAVVAMLLGSVDIIPVAAADITEIAAEETGSVAAESEYGEVVAKPQKDGGVSAEPQENGGVVSEPEDPSEEKVQGTLTEMPDFMEETGGEDPDELLEEPPSKDLEVFFLDETDPENPVENSFPAYPLTYGDLVYGYPSSSLTPLKIRIKYKGEGYLHTKYDYSSDNFTCYNISESSSISAGDPVTLEICPKYGKAAGSYTDTIRFMTDLGDVIYTEFRVRFNVLPQEVKYHVESSASPDNVDFGCLRYGDTDTSDERGKEFTFVNDGNIPLKFKISNYMAVLDPEEDSFVLEKKGDPEGKDRKVIKIKPDVSMVNRGSFDVVFEARPDRYYCPSYYEATYIQCRSDVDYYLYGDVPASMLSENPDWMIAGNTAITLADDDDVTVSRINYMDSDDGFALTIKGSDIGKLTTDGINVSGDLNIQAGTIRSKGALESCADIKITGGDVDANNTFNSYPAIYARKKVLIQGGNVRASGDTAAIAINAKSGVEITDATVYAEGMSYGISTSDGSVVIGGSAYASVHGKNEDGIQAGGTGNIEIKENATLHAVGAARAVSLAEKTGNEIIIGTGITTIPAGLESGVSSGYLTLFKGPEHNTSNYADDIWFRPAVTGDIDLAPSEGLDFGSVGYGDKPSLPDEENVIVTNNVTSRERIVSVTVSPEYFDVKDISGRYLMPGEPINIGIRPKKKLAAGDYVSTLTVTTESGKKKTVSLKYKVNAPVAKIEADRAKLDFGTVKEDYDEIGAVNVTITNIGDTEVNLNDPVISDDFEASLNRTKLETKGDTAILTIRPKTGLKAGDYSHADFCIDSEEGAFAKLPVGFIVEAWKYELSGESDEIDLGRMHVGYTTPVQKSFTFTNTGEKPLTISECEIQNDDVVIKEDIVGKKIDPGKTLKVTLAAPEGKSRRSVPYTGKVTVKTQEGAECSFTVKYSVELFIEGTVKASDLVYDFYRAYGDTTIILSPGDDVSIRSLECTGNLTIVGEGSGKLSCDGIISSDGLLKVNGGRITCERLISKGEVVICADADVYSGGITCGWDEGSVSVEGNAIVNIIDGRVYGNRLEVKDNAFLSVKNTGSAVILRDPDAAVTCGEGVAIIKPRNNSVDDYLGQYTVLDTSSTPYPATSVIIGATAAGDAGLEVKYTDINFGEYTTDDDIPGAREVTVINTGSVIQVLEKCECPSSFIATTPFREILRPGETTTFTVRPLALPEGEFTGDVTVKYDKSEEIVIHPSAKVVAPVYALKLTHNGEDITDDTGKAIDFGTFVVGYEGGTPHEITVTNMGNTVITLDDPVMDFTSIDWGSPFGFSVGKLSESVLAPKKSATFSFSVYSIFIKLAGDAPYKAKVDVNGKFKHHPVTASAYGTFNVEDTPEAYDGTTNIIWMMDIPDQTYTGSAINPEPEVYFGRVRLTDDDYKVSYKNNTNAYIIKEGQPGFELSKAPTVTITGKGKYAGTMTKPFVIKPLPIAGAYTDTDAMVQEAWEKLGSDIAHQTLISNGKVQKGSFKFYYDLPNGKTVTLNSKDYELAYPDPEPLAPAVYTITVKGHGNFTGERTVKLEIADKDAKTLISKVDFPKIPDQVYKGKKIIVKGAADPEKEEVKAVDKNGAPYDLVLTDKAKKHALIKDTDFEIYYSDNLEIGTAAVTVVGKGNYAGTVSKTFKITGTNIAKLKTKDYVKEFGYTGYAITQPMRFLDGGVELVEGVDYEAEHTNNTEIGTASVTYTGKGRYFGSVKKTYKITGFAMSKADVPKDFAGSKDYRGDYDAGSKSFIYTGEAFDVAGGEYDNEDQGIKLTYTYPDKTKEILRKGTDYKVSYSKNTDPGTATAEFTGIGKFYGTVKRTFKIKSYSLTDDETALHNRITVYYEPRVRWERGQNHVSCPKYKYLKAGVCPDPVVEYNFGGRRRILEKGKDYTLSYANNTAPGRCDDERPPIVTINGKGEFSGKLNYYFTIEDPVVFAGDYEVRDGNYTVTAQNYVINYTEDDYAHGSYAFLKKHMAPIKTKVTIKDADGTLLKEGVDYVKPDGYVYRYGVGEYSVVYTDGTVTAIEFQSGNYVIDDASSYGKTGENGKIKILEPLSSIYVDVEGLGQYEGMTFKGCFVYVLSDMAKAKITIPDIQYTGKPVKPEDADVIITVKDGKNEKKLTAGTDFNVLSATLKNNIEPGTASVDIMFNRSSGMEGVRTVTFKIVNRRMNYHITYDDGFGDADSGLVKALMDKYEWTAKYCKGNYRIVGTVKDSNIPVYGKLAANAFKVQMYDPDKKKWVDDKYITFKCWRLYYDKDDPAKYRDFAPKDMFEPSWLTRFVYGDTYTLTAIWDF